jgi:putative lipoprotein
MIGDQMTRKQLQNFWQTAVFSALLLLFITACSPADEPEANNAATVVPVEPTAVADDSVEVETEQPDMEPSLELNDTEWTLVTYGPVDNLTAVLPDTPATAVFGSDGEISGTTGCNSYFGSYTLAGDSFTTGVLGMTEMACMAGGIMEQESAFINALSAAQTISREGDTLVIEYEGGELHFTAAPPAPQASLVGTIWRLTGFERGDAIMSVLSNTAITAVFGQDQITGLATCNRYGSSYTLDGSTITMNGVEQTEQDCQGNGIMEQEAMYTNALATAVSYTLDGEQLVIQYADGALHFHTMPDLAGTNWRLLSFDGAAPVADTEITMMFDAAKGISGSAGCNIYNGSYSPSNDTVSFTALVTTKRACNEPVTMQENNFILALTESAVITFATDGGQLILVHDGDVMIFTAQ